MSTFESLWSKTLLHHLWQEFLVRYRFKFVLPRQTQANLEGIRLDLSRLSLKIRNRILMGIYEAHEKRLCQQFLNAQDAVLEIGGAIGFIGLVCQKKIGIHRYFVFEANPSTLEILRANYELNGLVPAAWNLALGPDDRMVDLEVTSDFWENSIVPSATQKSGLRSVQVPSASLAALLNKLGSKVNVLIIDVEGAEQFLDLDEIPREVNKLIIELHPAILGCEKTYELIAGLIQRGFYVAGEESGTFAFLKRESAAAGTPPRRWQLEELEPAL